MEDRPHGSERANVVHLETDTQRVKRVQIAKLPDAAALVLDRSKSLLREKVKSFFDLADDSLFELADKATSNQDQNVFFDSMRELRVQHRSIEMRFLDAVSSAFADLSTTQKIERQDDEAPEALSLVHSDDLEEMLAVDSAAARANTQFGEAIQFISLRLDTLLPVKVYQKNNPISPDVLCSAFMEQIKRLDVDMKAKLVLFRLFDKAIIQELGEVYRAINALLIEQNIMPSLPSVNARRRSHTAQSQRRHGSASQVNEPRQERLGSHDSESHDTGHETTSLSHQAVETLNQLLTDERSATDQQIVSANDLLGLLSQVQRQSAAKDSIERGSDIRALLDEVKSSAGITRDFGRVDDEVMNLVNMLFDFILEDRNLAAPMKALISRLQIPIIKLAVADKTFFTKGGHVGRRLLNEMATAAIGWECAAEDVIKDPLYAKISDVVKTLQHDKNINTDDLNEVFGDFTSFVTREKRKAAVFEKRTIDAEDGKARTEVARGLVSEAVRSRIKGHEIPEFLLQFIQEAWAKVLFVTALKHGSDCDQWMAVTQTLDELLWSVRPSQSDQHRQTLLRLIPVLLKKLRAGLDIISYNPYDMSAVFKSLESLHLAAIRSRAYLTAKSLDAPRDTQASFEAADTLGDSSTSQVVSDTVSSLQTGDPHNTHGSKKESNLASDAYRENGQEQDSAIEESARDEIVDSSLSHEPHADKAQTKKTQVVDASGHSAQDGATEALADDLAPLVASPVDVNLSEPSSKEVLADTDTWMLQVSHFAQGSWFDFTGEDGVVIRCRLAAVIKSVGRYIFVNRNGMKVAEKTQMELAFALKNGRLGILDNSMLFDRALETIVSGLRKPSEPS